MLNAGRKRGLLVSRSGLEVGVFVLGSLKSGVGGIHLPSLHRRYGARAGRL